MTISHLWPCIRNVLHHLTVCINTRSTRELPVYTCRGVDSIGGRANTILTILAQDQINVML